MMRAVTYTDPGEFLTVTEALFQADEARYGLIYGIAQATAANPHYYGPEDPWFCTVGDERGVTTAAWRTRPFGPGAAWLGGDVAATMPALLAAVRGAWEEIPSFNGHREIADPFAAAWCAGAGARITGTTAMTIYRVDTVNEVRPVPGALRPATEADKERIRQWSVAFNLDCWGEDGVNRPLLDADAALASGRLYFWENEGPVCMVGKTRPTEKGMTIGPVYTPPEERGKGYATATTAAVCREILAEGKAFCTLYADRDNPASNAAYLKVGFRIIGDSAEYTFGYR